MTAEFECREHEHGCHCVLPTGHDGPHECVPDPACGGSWWRHPDDPPNTMRVYRYPSNRPECDGYEATRADLRAHGLDPTPDPPPGEYVVEELVPILSALRGGIRFPVPPSLAEFARAKEAELLDKMREPDA